MAAADKPVRLSVRLPSRTARLVWTMARARRTTVSRVLVDLIESGLDAKEREGHRYSDLLERLRSSSDPGEQERLTAELSQLTYGE